MNDKRFTTMFIVTKFMQYHSAIYNDRKNVVSQKLQKKHRVFNLQKSGGTL